MMTATVLVSLMLTGVPKEVGLKVGDTMTAFDPYHVSGPTAGTYTCPVCEYINLPMVQMWVSGGTPEDIAPVARLLDKAVGKYAAKELHTFVIRTVTPQNRDDVAQSLQAFAQLQNLNRVALTVLPTTDHGVSDHKFTGKSIIYVYVRRKITAKFVDFVPTQANLSRLSQEIAKICR
ncbi:MAG: hypothetical protein JNM85_06625 [Chthonomonas sp.]|nr:hypothetical protein [Chthonomonas sp.]